MTNVNASDPSARGFGAGSVDSPGDQFMAELKQMEESQSEFGAMLDASEHNAMDEEIGESGGSSEEALFEMEGDEDSALDFVLSDPLDIEESTDEMMQEVHKHAEEKFVKEDHDKLTEDLQEMKQLAVEDAERLEEMEDAEMMDLDDLQLGMEAEGDADVMQEMAFESQIQQDEISNSEDRQGRSAGYMDAEASDEFMDEITQEQVLSFLKHAEEEQTENAVDAILQHRLEEDVVDDRRLALEAAELEHDRIADAEQDELTDFDDLQTMMDVAEGAAEQDVELPSEPEPQIMTDETFEHSDRQGRSAGYMDAEASDELMDEITQEQVSSFLKHAEEEQNENAVDAILQHRLEEDVVDDRRLALEAAELEHDRIADAEQDELTDFDDLQVMHDAAEGAIEQDLELVAAQELSNAEGQSDGTGSDQHGNRSATYIEAMDVGAEVESEDDLDPTSVLQADSLSQSEDTAELMRMIEELEERELRFEQAGEQNEEHFTNWIDQVFEDISEGDRLQLSVDELFEDLSEDEVDGPAENNSMLESFTDASVDGTTQDSTDGASAGRETLQQGNTELLTTPGEAILTTMGGAKMGRSLDQQLVRPEVYRMVNSIEAKFYSVSQSSVIVTGEDNEQTASAVGEGSLGIDTIANGVEIELKNDKYTNLGGTKISFRRNEDMLEINFRHDSLHVQELLVSQGELLLKELDGRFPGGIQISLNDVIVASKAPTSEQKQVQTSVVWDAPKA